MEDEREFSAIYESIDDSGESDGEDYVTVSDQAHNPGPYLCPEPKGPAPLPPTHPPPSSGSGGGEGSRDRPTRRPKLKRPIASNSPPPSLPPKPQQAPKSFDGPLPPAKPRKLPKPGTLSSMGSTRDKPAALPRGVRTKPQTPPGSSSLPQQQHVGVAYRQTPGEWGVPQPQQHQHHHTAPSPLGEWAGPMGGGGGGGHHTAPAPLPRGAQNPGRGEAVAGGIRQEEDQNQYDSISETRKMLKARKNYRKLKNPAETRPRQDTMDEYIKMQTMSTKNSLSSSDSSDDLLGSSLSVTPYRTRVVCIVLAITVTSLLVAVVSLVLALYSVVALSSHTRATPSCDAMLYSSSPPSPSHTAASGSSPEIPIRSPSLNMSMMQGAVSVNCVANCNCVPHSSNDCRPVSTLMSAESNTTSPGDSATSSSAMSPGDSVKSTGLLNSYCLCWCVGGTELHNSQVECSIAVTTCTHL